MPRKRFEAFVAAATALAIVASACGDSSTSPQDLSAATAATRELERFLIRADEAPGFAPSGKPLASSLREIAAEDRKHGEGSNEERLSDHGFEVSVGQALKGPSDAAGASSVQLFATEDGATRELEYLVSQIGKLGTEVRVIERFDVPGVPTASGWTSEKAGGGALDDKVVVANVVWSQGRCVLGLGSEPAFADRLRDGVKAIHERTGGRCP